MIPRTPFCSAALHTKSSTAFNLSVDKPGVAENKVVKKSKSRLCGGLSLPNPNVSLALDTDRADENTERSVIRRKHKFSSVKKAVSEKSEPTHAHPFCNAKGLYASSI